MTTAFLYAVQRVSDGALMTFDPNGFFDDWATGPIRPNSVVSAARARRHAGRKIKDGVACELVPFAHITVHAVTADRRVGIRVNGGPVVLMCDDSSVDGVMSAFGSAATRGPDETLNSPAVRRQAGHVVPSAK